MSGDPFATGQVRERVLAAWSASPVRFREDANAEEDFALGGYRDRLAVELAQNAADAAARAGVAGRLLLAVRTVDGRPALLAANTGAPLDAAGVEALATLRASAKRGEDAVGRFGVGFSAVLAVTDEPAVLSRTGGVRFSAAATRVLLERVAGDVPALAEELARRSGHVPVLRLPFPADGEPPPGYDTAVLLPLRDARAEDVVLRRLAEVDDGLLLALPGLAEIVVEVPGQPARRLADVDRRWHVLRRTGTLDAAVLADRPTEERSRTSWSVTWALPASGEAAAAPAVVHAPTPSEDPLPWTALLVATLPLESSRRHVAPGPATDAVLAEAARAYADLLTERARAGDEAWRLVPVGLPAGTVDAALREALDAILPGTPLLRAAEGQLLRPRDAVVLEPPAGGDAAAVRELAPRIAGLVLSPRAATAAFAQLGVRRIALADVVEQLPPPRDSAGWAALYGALAGLADDASAREALARLPVLLADGRVVRGARGTVLPGGRPDVARALAVLGIRAVSPDAAATEPARALLRRLGAAEVGPGAALELPPVRAGVEALADGVTDGMTDGVTDGMTDGMTGDADGGPHDVPSAVLTLVAAALEAGDLPPDPPGPGRAWLGELPLPDVDGEPVPAADLALPGSAVLEVVDPDAVGEVDPGLVERWGRDVLRATGVLDGMALLRTPDLPLEPEDDLGGGPVPERVLDLDGLDEWLDHVGALAADVPTPLLAELVAVRDLDAVRDGAWPAVLAQLAQDPRLRAAVVEPARVVPSSGAGPSRRVPSYTAWWLRRRLAGGPWADPDAEDGVADLLPAAPDLLAGLDPGLRAALGAVRAAGDLDGDAVATVLARLGDEAVRVDAPTALRIWSTLARLALEVAPEAAAPACVRVLDPDGAEGTRVVTAAEAVVVDAPVLLQRPDLGWAVVVADPDGAAALADLLDLPLAAELAPGVVHEAGPDGGTPAPVPAQVAALLPGAPSRWCEHDRLLVDGVDVDWWVSGQGTDAEVHAATLDGLARGLAWAAGAWWRRSAVAEVLADPLAVAGLLAEEAFGDVRVGGAAGTADR